MRDFSGSIGLIEGMLGGSSSIGGRAVRVTSPNDSGILFYGPYERREKGRYRVEFEIALNDAADVIGDPVAAKIDVVADQGRTLIVEKFLLLSDLAASLTMHALEFELQGGFELEYRVAAMGQVGLACIGEARVTAIMDVAPTRALRGTQERAWQYELEFLDGYLRNISGVIHVGANRGQERRYYWLLGIDVLWVEALEEMYDLLVANIACYPNQRAVRALLTDRDGDEYDFNVSDSGAGSSSILPFEEHARIFPDIRYVEQRKLRSRTLDTLLADHVTQPGRFQALTLDVEGAELLVLKGATQALRSFDYVKCEVSDFPARTGTPSTADLDAVLGAAGYRQLIRRVAAMGPENRGTMWDIVWKRVEPGQPLNAPGLKLPVVAHPQDVSGLEKSE